jgi:ABC-2 type transport system ATP-binding protein
VKDAGHISVFRAAPKPFELPLDRRMRRLSRGMRSAVGIVIGLAARADLTLFDEPYAGLDAVARQLFYDRLLADFAEHPRTIVLSTHLIDEVGGLARTRRGARSRAGGAGRARGRDPRHRYDRERAGHRGGGVRGGPPGLAPAAHRLACLGLVPGPLDAAAQARARALHLSLEPLSLQQLLVHASGIAEEKVSA